MDQIEELLDAAFAAAEAGRLGDAEAICHEVLAQDPGNFDALSLLGVVAGETERFDLAEELLRAALVVDPDSAAASLQLGGVLVRAGKREAAIEILRVAVRLAPEESTTHHDLGVSLLDAGRAAEAVDSFRAFLRHAPDSADGHYRLGLALELEGDDRGAIESFRRAAELAPKQMEPLAHLARLLHENGHIEELLDVDRRVAEVHPETTDGRVCAARVLAASGDVMAAERKMAAAIALDPEDSALFHLHGAYLAELGRFDEAVERFRRSIAADRLRADSYFALANTRKVTEADPGMIEEMGALLTEPRLSDRERLLLHFALGKAYDDLRHYEEAIRHYDEGNRLKRLTVDFDPAGGRRMVEMLIAKWGKDVIERSAASGSDSELPVLVVGMPRSGTTLVEQILSSHPEITGAGEQMFWGRKAVALSPIPDAGLDPSDVRSAAAEYCALLRGLAPDAKRVVDKLPENFFYAALVRNVFPKARIIHCRRDPVDTCLSIYFTLFETGMEYSYRRDEIVARYQDYLRLMAHWRNELDPSRFLEVDYEDIVADKEGQTRRLIEFCGLDWDDRCLNHEDSARTIRTASFWQARQPVYQSSVARWKRYEPWLGEFRRLLPEVTDHAT